MDSQLFRRRGFIKLSFANTLRPYVPRQRPRGRPGILRSAGSARRGRLFRSSNQSSIEHGRARANCRLRYSAANAIAADRVRAATPAGQGQSGRPVRMVHARRFPLSQRRRRSAHPQRASRRYDRTTHAGTVRESMRSERRVPMQCRRNRAR